MAEVSNERIYEILKTIRARLANIEDTQRDHSAQFIALRGDLRSIHAEISSMKDDIINIYEVNNAHDARLTRIERRLDIIDSPIG